MESDTDSLALKLENDLYYPKLSTRLQSISNILDEFRNTNNLKSGMVKRMVRSVIISLIFRKFQEQSWINSQLEFLNKVFLNETLSDFLGNAFVEIINDIKLRITDDQTKHNFAQLCLQVMKSHRICAVTITGEGDGEDIEIEASNWLKSLCIAFGEVINNLITLSKTTKLLNSLNHGRSDLVNLIVLSCVRACKVDSAKVLTTLCLTFHLIETKSPNLRNMVVKKVIEVYINKYLSLKEALSSATIETLHLVISRLNADDWNRAQTQVKDSLETTVIKTMKKSPDGSSFVVSSLVASLTLDLSAFARAGAAACGLRLLKSSEETVRMNGIRFMDDLVSKCTAVNGLGDADAACLVVTTLAEALQGKGGPLTNGDHRAAIAVSLLNAAKSFTDSKSLLPLLVPALTSALEKDTDEGNKHILAFALGTWLALPDSTGTSTATVAFTTGLTGKSKTSYLMALFVAQEGNRGSNSIRTICLLLEAHVEVLVVIIKDALKKPQASHPAAVLAFRLLLDLIACSPSALQIFESNKLWTCLHASNSFLNSNALLTHLQQLDTSQNPDLLSHVLPRDGQALFSQLVVKAIVSTVSAIAHSFPRQLLALAPDTATDSLVLGLFHDSKAIRSYSLDQVAAVIQAMPKMSEAIISRLWKQLAQASTEEEARPIYSSSSSSNSLDEFAAAGNSSTKRSCPPHSRYLEALLAIAPATEGATSSVVPFPFVQALLVLSHPFVSPSYKTAERTWAKLLARLVPNLSTMISQHENIESIATETMELINTAIFHTPSSSSPSPCSMRIAGQTALALVAATAIDTNINADIRDFFMLICNKQAVSLCSALRSNDLLQQFSQEEVEAFLRPDLFLSTVKNASTGDDNSDLRITNADRKKDSSRSSRRGQFGADVLEDEDWAKRVLQEKAAKVASVRDVEASASRRRELDDITSRISRALNSVVCGLELVLWLCHRPGSRWLVQGYFGAILSSCLNLLPSKLVHEKSCICLEALVTFNCDESLQPFTRDIIDSLRIVAMYFNTPLTELESEQQRLRLIQTHLTPIQRLLKELQLLVKQSKSRNSVTSTLIPFPGSVSIELLFPILKAVLNQSVILPGCDYAFAIFDALFQTDPSTQYAGNHTSLCTLADIEREVIETCLVVLSKHKVDPSPDSVFLRVISRKQLAEHEWRPVLSTVGFLSPEHQVRLACLRGVEAIITSDQGQGMGESLTPDPFLETCLWLLKFDEVELVSAKATDVWDLCHKDLSISHLDAFIALLSHDMKHVRHCAGRAIAGGMLAHVNDAAATIARLQALYTASRPPVVVLDKRLLAPVLPRGTDGKLDLAAYIATDHNFVASSQDLAFPTRVAIAHAFKAMGTMRAISSTCDGDDDDRIVQALRFIIESGVVDSVPEVRQVMLEAGQAIVHAYGAMYSASILQVLRTVLDRKPDVQENLDDFDSRYESTVILLGAAGKHLQKEDPSITVITEALVEALKTPSESVQKAVSDCLVSLVQTVKAEERTKELLEVLMTRVLEADTYGERRGAGYGIAAFVKGCGIPSLKNHDIVNRLREACSNGTPTARQGSLFAFELLSDRLGLLFEPYVVTFVPVLLKSFSHSSDLVREASRNATKVVMNRLSAHGVKQILTPILNSLPCEPQWKTRQEAIRLLGSMAHCAPRQLATCLPQIIPRLVEASSDVHPKVKESARNSLADISSVIKNPEILRLSPILLAALSDPANKLKDALEALLECEFMHSIDVPSLALLVPILARALKDRGADLKRKSSAITGNMMSMVSEPKALTAYLSQVLPGLKDCLIDPIPDVRATSAKAVGSIVGGVGEEEVPEFMDWLMKTMRSELSPVERSGAAQGLAEICCALGHKRTEELLKDLLKLKNSPNSASREGLLWLLSFLPASMQEEFAQYIHSCLPVVLIGLSDDNEGVREVALRSGQVIVSTLGKTHASEILPSLSLGIFDEDWRIRHSSVLLLGDLFFLIGDTKAVGIVDGEDGEDEGLYSTGTSRALVAIKRNIGEEATEEMLASIYIIKCDISIVVRQVALQVWKTVVTNTPRTLVEIMPILVRQFIEKLSSDIPDLRLVASRALGEVVRKQGDRILPRIVPLLQAGLDSDDQAMRQGVVLGLAEVLAAASQKQIEVFIDILTPALQQALCDVSTDVRAQGAKAFLTLFKAIGPRCMHDIVPLLLAELEGPDIDTASNEYMYALQGLKEVVQARPRDLLEYLLPRLLTSTKGSGGLQACSARVLEAVVAVAGAALNHHFAELVSGLVYELYTASDSVVALANTVAQQQELEGSNSTEEYSTQEQYSREVLRFEAIKSAASGVMAAVTTSGVNSIMLDLGRQMEHETNARRRRWGCWLLQMFITRSSRADFGDYITIILKHLLSRVIETDKAVLQAASDALLALSVSSNACCTLDVLMEHVEFIKNYLASVASDARHRAGSRVEAMYDDKGQFLMPMFSLPKALEPFLTIFIYGLMNGSNLIRETAADAIGELISMSDPVQLKPYLIKTTGPLIRVVGDRYPSPVKAAILQTLGALLDKGGASLKAFVPQLQTTFVKALSDPSKQVRRYASTGLARLMPLTARVDSLITELCNNVVCLQAEGSNAIKTSVLEALSGVLMRGGDKAGVIAMDKAAEAIGQCLDGDDDDENVRHAASAGVGALGAFLEGSRVSAVLSGLLVPRDGYSPGRVLGIAGLLQTAGQKITAEKRQQAFGVIVECMNDARRPDVRTVACNAAFKIFSTPSFVGSEARKLDYRSNSQAAVHAFAKALTAAASDSTAPETKRAAIAAIKQASKNYPGASAQHSQAFMPPLISALHDINLGVKYSAERAMKYLLDASSTGTAPALDSDAAKFVKDYAKRVLSKLPSDSDDEGGKW